MVVTRSSYQVVTSVPRKINFGYTCPTCERSIVDFPQVCNADNSLPHWLNITSAICRAEHSHNASCPEVMVIINILLHRNIDDILEYLDSKNNKHSWIFCFIGKRFRNFTILTMTTTIIHAHFLKLANSFRTIYNLVL